jgi:hypothetical protein
VIVQLTFPAMNSMLSRRSILGGWDLLQTGCLASLNPRFSPLLDFFVSNNEEGTTQKNMTSVVHNLLPSLQQLPGFLGGFPF